MTFRFTRRAFLVALAAGAVAPSSVASTMPYLQRAEVREFIDNLLAQHPFDRERVERWFSNARYSPTVERLMQPSIPFGRRNWLEYRTRYLDEQRVQAGVQFWRTQQAELERAQQQYGVPPEIIVAIIGVESTYGRITGNFRTLDVLATLSFDYLRRAEFYRQQLVDFLLLAREQNADPLTIKGSFAGAIGLPQFMPGSIRRFAVDFDGDGRIDLTSAPDSIGSVASFLVAHGWQRELPILLEVQPDEALDEAIETWGRGIDTGPTWSDVLARGVVADEQLPLDTRVIVIDLPYITPAGESRRLDRVGTVNFSALLHYNRSYFYAASVTELAQAIASGAAR
jgi:membrane-bound lytic murein transglycosylase B